MGRRAKPISTANPVTTTSAAPRPSPRRHWRWRDRNESTVLRIFGVDLLYRCPPCAGSQCGQAEHPVLPRGRSVLPARQRLWRAGDQDACLRPRRPRGCSVHASLLRRAIVYAVPQRDPDRPGHLAAGTRRATVRNAAGRASGLYGPVDREWLSRGLFGQGLGARKRSGRWPHVRIRQGRRSRASRSSSAKHPRASRGVSGSAAAIRIAVTGRAVA